MLPLRSRRKAPQINKKFKSGVEFQVSKKTRLMMIASLWCSQAIIFFKNMVPAHAGSLGHGNLCQRGRHACVTASRRKHKRFSKNFRRIFNGLQGVEWRRLTSVCEKTGSALESATSCSARWQEPLGRWKSVQYRWKRLPNGCL